MKFGVFSSLSGSHARSSSDANSNQISPLIRAEAQGYDSAWIGESGAARYGTSPAVHLHAAQLAARTQTIRIGSVVCLRSNFHPLRLAEEAAMLDIMSGGRLEQAVGLDLSGGDAHDSEPGRRHRVLGEQLDVLRSAWQGMPFSHEGEFFRFPLLECVPTPVQRPHPPIHVAACASQSFEWAAAGGHAVLADAFAPLERLALHGARSVVRVVHCGESVSAAREQAGPALMAAYAASAGANSEATLDFLFEQCAIVGDAAYCRDRIAELQERVGSDQLLTWHDAGGLPAEAASASQQRFVEHVAPSFR